MMNLDYTSAQQILSNCLLYYFFVVENYDFNFAKVSVLILVSLENVFKNGIIVMEVTNEVIAIDYFFVIWRQI